VYKYSKAYSGNEHIEFIEQDIFITNVPLDAIYNKTENNGELNGELNGEINGDINGDINGEINGEIKKVYIIVLRNEGIKAKDIAKQANRPKNTIDKYLKILKNHRMISYKGSNKTGGYYKIT
jgi:ATP-dependent DNA helicase RecG